MDEEQLTMMEAQVDMVDLLAKYPNAAMPVVSMCFKIILDCYVKMMGEADTAKLLEHSISSVLQGNHNHDSSKMPKIPKRLLN